MTPPEWRDATAWRIVCASFLFATRVTALALSGMLLIVAAGLAATLPRSGRLAAIAEPPNTL